MQTQFNLQRLVKLDLHGHAQQFRVNHLIPLSEALATNVVQPATPILYTKQNNTLLVFQTRHLSLYNVMQGEIDGQPWMASFCAVCNAGMSFSPVVNNTVLDFYGAGFYDAMILLADRQTESYWDHITGECVYGVMQGAALQRLASMYHSTAGELVRTDADACFAVSTLTLDRQPLDDYAEMIRTSTVPPWIPPIQESLVVEDTRLPRFEMGLGVWTDKTTRFYPFQTLHALDNILFDEIDGQRLLVYVDPESLNPAALFTDATAARWRGETLLLSNGQSIRDGGLYEYGELCPANRPLQLFQRWYGFSLTFPGCEIYTSR